LIVTGCTNSHQRAATFFHDETTRANDKKGRVTANDEGTYAVEQSRMAASISKRWPSPIITIVAMPAIG